jgi:CHAT domain-containing protein/tetratricopeptide (TPR) repeat protein
MLEDPVDLLLEFLGAQSVDEIRAILDEHGDELATDACDAMLARFIVLGAERGDEFVRELRARRRLLQRYLDVGADQAVSEWASPGGRRLGDRPQATVQDVVRRLGALAGPEQTTERIELLEQLLARLPADFDAAAVATLQYALASSYLEVGQGEELERVDRAVELLEALVAVGRAGMTLTHFVDAQFQLGAAYLRRADLGRRDRVDDAITAFRAAAAAVEDAGNLEQLGAIQNELGIAYMLRPLGGRAENVEEAIACFERSLTATGRSPFERAASLHNLGNAFRHRLYGDRVANVERAVEVFREALDVRTRRDSPVEWAMTLVGLGSANCELLSGDRAGNVERAIGCFDGALSVYSCDDHPTEWAALQHELAGAYTRRVVGDRATNLEEAIRCCRLALGVRTRAGLPFEWAQTQNTLGTAYAERIDGDRDANIDQAIIAFHEALEVFIQDAYPSEWATVQGNLGVAYTNTGGTSRPEHIEQAIRYLEAARDHAVAASGSLEAAMREHNLAAAYQERVLGVKDDNAEAAIRTYRDAQRRVRRDEHPVLWATIEHNVGLAYLARQGGDDEATVCFDRALEVRTRDANPFDWAMTQAALGAALSRRSNGNDDDRRRAIECYEAALEVLTPEDFPSHCHKAADGLGDAYAGSEQWQGAARAFRVALAAADILYEGSITREAKQAELASRRDLHGRAAYAMARAGDTPAAVVTLERGRARGLGDVLARDSAQLIDAARRYPSVHDAYEKAAREVRQLEARERRHALATFSPDHPDDEAADLLRRRSSDSFRGDLVRAESALRAARDRIRQLDGMAEFLSQPTMADVAGAAGASTPLAYLAVTDNGPLVLLVVQEGDRTLVEAVSAGADDTGRSHSLTAATLSSVLIEREGGSVTGGYLPGQVEGRQEWITAALDELLVLLSRLMAPIAYRLARLDATGVVLIPCGLLALMPLHAVPTGPGEFKCLLDQLDVMYAPSARVLTLARSRSVGVRESEGARLVAVGNPDTIGEQRLPWAELEIEEAARAFGDNSVVLLGETATRDAVVNAASGATHIHLAVHASFDAASPLESELLLAGDDRLTLRELLEDRPFRSASLVVASACKTGMSEFSNLPDEAIGLFTGLIEAGTPTVISTLWAIGDSASAILMGRFYQLSSDGAAGAGPMAPPRALRASQRWLAQVTAGELAEWCAAQTRRSAVDGRTSSAATAELAKAAVRYRRRDANERPFAHPINGAPFVLAGAAGSPLQSRTECR